MSIDNSSKRSSPIVFHGTEKYIQESFEDLNSLNAKAESSSEVVSPLGMSQLIEKISPSASEGSNISSKKGIHWNPELTAAPREFERTPEEITRMFSDFILKVPQAPSRINAERYLDELRMNPNISPYISSDTDLSVEDILGDVHDKIKQGPTTPIASLFTELHLIDLLKTQPELIEVAYSLLAENPETQKILFSQQYVNFESAFINTWRILKQGNNISLFLSTILEIFPLEMIAKIKRESDFVYLATALNNCLPEEARFPNSRTESTEEIERLVQDIKVWIGERSNLLNRFKTLSLGTLEISSIDQEIINALLGVKTVSFQNSQLPLDPNLLNDIVKLPNLEELNFSYTSLSLDAVTWILDAIKKASNLKTLDISNTGIDYETAEPLISFCAERGIDLLLSSFTSTQNDHLIVLNELRVNLGDEIIEPPTSSSLLHPEAFSLTVNGILDEWGSYCPSLVTLLDFSYSSIRSIPEEYLEYLKGVKEVNLSYTYLEPTENLSSWHSIFTALSRLKKIETLNLEGNHLDANSLNLLLPSLKKLENLKSINLSNNPVTAEEVPLLIEYCYDKNITLEVAIPEKEKDRNSLIAHFSSLGCPNMEDLQTLKQLDLSVLGLKHLPEDLLPFLTGLENVKFTNSQASLEQKIEIIKSLLTLPNLSIINISKNDLNDEALKELYPAFQKAKKLTVVNLSEITDEGEEINFRNIPELVNHFADNKIYLCKPYSISVGTLWRVLGNFGVTIPSAYMDAQDLFDRVRPSLEAKKESLKHVKSLDFSEKPLETLPDGFLDYFPSVSQLIFSGTFTESSKNYSAFTQLIQLPKLKEIDLSNNYIKPSILANLSDLVRKSDRTVEEIDLTNCSVFMEPYKKFIELCYDNGVNLIRNYNQEESNLVTVIEAINTQLPHSCQIVIPNNFKSAEHLIEQMKPQLQVIETLDLSNIPLQNLDSKLFSYLSNLKKIDLNHVNLSDEVLETLIVVIKSSPKLESINLSRTPLSPTQTDFLVEALKQAPSIKEIDVSHTGISPIEWGYRKFNNFCLAKGIRATYAGIKSEEPKQKFVF
jgi:Ran GTPase-activating protein (RanGAP) involved in mRNA processing and transport